MNDVVPIMTEKHYGAILAAKLSLPAHCHAEFMGPMQEAHHLIALLTSGALATYDTRLEASVPKDTIKELEGFLRLKGFNNMADTLLGWL